MRKEMKRRAREGLAVPDALLVTQKPRGRPPKAESARPPGRPAYTADEHFGASSRKRSSQHLLLESPLKTEPGEMKKEPHDDFGPSIADRRPFSAALPSSPKKARRSFMPEVSSSVTMRISAVEKVHRGPP